MQAANEYADAGFTDLALVQIGNDRQEEFVRWDEKDLVPALRDL